MFDHIPISVECLRQALRYDAATGRLFWRKRTASHFDTEARAAYWNARYAGFPAGSRNKAEGYIRIILRGRTLYAHRIIWALTFGEWPGGEIDHANGDRADNHLANLRVVQPGKNQQNQKLRSNNTSGAQGVRWLASRGKWHASIRVNYKAHHLGVFDTFEEALRARRAGERLYGFHPNHGRIETMQAASPSRTVTLAQLRKAGACADQVDPFRRMFGKSVELTEALAVEHAALFNWDWGAANLLSTPARQAYEAATAPARQAYEAATAPARQAYKAARASAWQAYEAARASAWQAYEAARASAFARAYIEDGKP